MKSVEAVDILNRVAAILTDSEDSSESMDGVLSILSKRLEMHDKGIPVFSPRKKCIHEEMTEERYTGEAQCGGKVVICHCEENPVKLWYSCGCNKNKCAYFTEGEK
jgi:hypothetical protein